MRRIKGYISGRDGSRLSPVGEKVVFEKNVYRESEMINIFPERRYQEILGFGGAFTEASAFVYAKMDEKTKHRVIKAFFDKEEGLGYNFCRTHIHSCDFSLERYTYTDEGDRELNSFTIEKDRSYILPFIKAATDAAEGILLFASPWSPPGWMKSNGELCHGGRLLEEYYSSWADYIVRYLQEYGKEGIPFFAVTVQNEGSASQTWESCVYTAEEEARFVHEYLRPAMDRAGYGDVRVMIWDHNKERVYERARDSFQVPGAREDIWGIAFHWYSGDHFAALDMAHESFPEKPLILTEAGLGGARGETQQGPYSTWENAEIYSRELIGDFNHYTAAAVEWNLILDEKGGPYHDRPGGCKAPLIYDCERGELSIQPVYYAIAHFSRFIRRGAVRLGTSSFCEGLKTVAFENPDGEIVLIILNCREKEHTVYIRLQEETAEVRVPGKSLSTYVITANEKRATPEGSADEGEENDQKRRDK